MARSIYSSLRRSIYPADDFIDKLTIGREIDKVAAAAEQQSLLKGHA